MIDPIDGLTIATVKTGSGSNLPGYYVFAGGSNPKGVKTTLEEARWESGYWNEYPDLSYDFQAAIRETGEIASSYLFLKSLHYFLNEFGVQLAPMTPVIPTETDPIKDLQYAVRIKGNAGFLFASNYYRGYQKPVQKNVQFHISLSQEVLTFPVKPVDISDSIVFIWLFNFLMRDIWLKYATAQPIYRMEKEDTSDRFFMQTQGVASEFCFDSLNLKSVKQEQITVNKLKGKYTISNAKTGLSSPIILETNTGDLYRIFILSPKQSRQFRVFKQGDKKFAFLSNANLYMDENLNLYAFGLSEKFSIIPFSGNINIEDRANVEYRNEKHHLYTEYKIQFPGKH